MASTVSVLEIYYGAKGLRKTGMTDFGKFAGELAEELGKRDSPQARERQSAGDSVPLWSCCLRFQVGIRATFCFDVCFSSHPWSAFARVFYMSARYPWNVLGCSRGLRGSAGIDTILRVSLGVGQGS